MVTHSLPVRNRLPGRFFARRIDWVRVALLVTPYVIATVWFVFSTRFWSSAGPPFAEFVITHRFWIRVGTAVMAATSALFFFWPREAGRLTGWWSGFVGLAFSTFLVQYSLRFIDLWLPSAFDPPAARILHLALEALLYLCSALNNLLFLAAARILLNKNKKPRESPPPPHDGAARGFKRRMVEGFRLFKHKVGIAFEEFRSALPPWTWVAAGLALLALLDTKPGFLWARFPDAIFSAYCLAWFGYALASNFNVRKRAFLATLALLVALVYGAGQLVFAVHPIIAYAAPPNTSQTFPLSWVRKKLGKRVNDLAVGINDKLNAQSQGGANDRPRVYPKDVLDGALFALLLPMKVALFIPAFFLYLLFISSVNDFRQALGEAISKRQDYLSSDGVVKGIGESLEAERVSLFIRIPGVQKRPGIEEERVLPLMWDAADKTVSRRQEDPFPIDADPLLVKAMKEEGHEILEPPSPEGEPAAGRQAAEESFPWLVPVKFHGGVIGVLRATLKRYRKNHTTLQKLRLMADIVAPSVQDFRSLAAADQIGSRFTRLQVDYPDDSFEKATERMVEVLHDVLAPLATGMSVEVGFQPFRHVYPKQGPDGELLTKPEAGRAGDEEVRVEDMPMLIWTGDGPLDGYLPVGTLSLAMRAKKDVFSQPTLAAYGLTRKMAASFATDGLFDVARDSLGAIIKDLGVEFSKEALTLEEWFDAVAHAVEKAKLTWVVATNGTGEEAQCAEEDDIKVIRAFSDEEKEALSGSPLSRLGQESLLTSHAVRLRLSKSGHQLWFGLARPEFGPELSFESPWKAFLRELKDVADTALKSLQQRQLTEAEKIKTAQYQGVMTIAVTTGTLMHQLLNMIKDQLDATEVLEEQLGDGDGGSQINPGSLHLLRTMKGSAVQMQELTKAFKGVTKMEERRPCSLKEAADQSLKLFEVSLLQRRIKATSTVSPELEVDVPFYVVAFALANIIGNAKEAVRTNGWIEIEAEENDTFILCHVTNNGPKIPPAVQSSLFKFGKTTKDGHNGWGLYFVEKSLIENGGGIRLSYSTQEKTRFTVRLPKPKPT